MAEDTSGDYDVMELSKAVELICKQAKDVHINDISINTLAEQVICNAISYSKEFYLHNNCFVRPLTYVTDTVIKADWLFVLHTLNFSLWCPKGTEQWDCGAEGFPGLCNAMRRAIYEKKPIWDPNYYTKITRNELEYILRSKNSKTTIPLLDERLKILHDVGEILLKKYQGTFMECIKLSEYDANKLLKLLFDEFESYRDEVIYNGKKDEPLEFGSREEIEIRGCSLFVMQKICNEVHNRINQRYKADERILKIKSLDIPVMVDNCFLRMMFYDNISFQQSPFHYIKTLHY
ncbi:queuosine salvage protein-like isoform X2 [Nylanderia fulva]|uniref:queuosine salvage protein-like isoform X2 n=1 Tax=Nylanderia fulva TaxID=613905 RepID=UPI0010FB7294|nr:queuosine salvage protein-like isoform X2 [Nylanderia fulva]